MKAGDLPIGQILHFIFCDCLYVYTGTSPDNTGIATFKRWKKCERDCYQPTIDEVAGRVETEIGSGTVLRLEIRFERDIRNRKKQSDFHGY